VQKKLRTVQSRDAQQIVATVRNNAQQVWLAGLGALAAVQSEGNKALNIARTESARVFAALVTRGRETEARARQAATKQAEIVTSKTSETMGKLEQVFEKRLCRSLKRLGVPTSDEVSILAGRVEDLTETVKTLAHRKTPARAPRKSARA
jgi:poly(hydroxyalkanoate) granule-associated protein